MAHRTWQGFGEVKTMREWANDARLQVPVRVFQARLYELHWPLEKALTLPASHSNLVNKHRATIHGETGTPLFNVWMSVKGRCRNKRQKDYGGRGISICDEWVNDYVTFSTWARANGYAPGLQIDRIDNDGDYSPENCRFVTNTLNARNKRSNRLLEAFGETKCLIEWSEDTRCIVGLECFRSRIYNNWEVERALTTPKMS